MNLYGPTKASLMRRMRAIGSGMESASMMRGADAPAICQDIKYPVTAAKLLTRIRRAAGPHVTVADDRDTGCYRATADAGFRFDEDLHELVSCYVDDLGMPSATRRIAALVDLLGRFALPGGYRAEPCEGECDWCGREEASR